MIQAWLHTMFDDTNKILLIKKRTIEELNIKIIELGSKVKEYENNQET
jgi:hypothetical protein